MHTVKSKEEFIYDIRAIDPKLSRIRLSEVVAYRSQRVIKYCFICDSTIDGELQEKIHDEAEKITSPIFKAVEISVKKIVSNPDLVNNEIYKYIKSKYPSISIFLTEGDIKSEVIGDIVRYVLRLTKDGVEYVRRNNTLITLNEYLATKFCSDFAGSTEIKEVTETIDLTNDQVFADELERVERRTIKVKDVVVIDDFTMGDTAYYIEDSKEGNIIVCGRITEITERQTSTGKPFFILHLDDTTERTSGIYFSKKNTYNQIKELKEGDAIIARGNISEYKGKMSTTFDKINRCTFPEDFVKKENYKTTPPREYKTVFPTASETVKVESVFDRKTEIPEILKDKEYVVFDLETTGKDPATCYITEIGAVRIKGGEIVEQFTTLINPHVPISSEITNLTGISDDMVKDAPDVKKVIPDFLKFCSGAILVAHNGKEFDMKFIRRFAKECDYAVVNEDWDTLEISRKYLTDQKKHDLHTLAERFNIVFRHHRALSDAYATAEIFIELAKIMSK